MNRTFIKLDASHDRGEFVMASTTERDQWARVFGPVPHTHERKIYWEGLKLIVETVPRATPPAEPDPVDEVLRAELDRLSDADLETRAAELGVAMPPKRFGKPPTRAQVIAAILKGKR